MAVPVKRTDLPDEVVLMLRVLAIAWFLTGHALIVSERSVPFFPFLAPLADSNILGWAELVMAASVQCSSCSGARCARRH